MSAENTKKAKTLKLGVFERYRSLLLSLTIFLVAIAALMSYSVSLSRYVSLHSREVQVVARAAEAHENIIRNLFGLKVSYGEDPNSPHVSHALKNLQANFDVFQKNLDALQKGGEALTIAGNTIQIPPVDGAENQKRLQAVAERWNGLKPQIANYLKDATSPTSNIATLDLATMSAQNTFEQMNGDMAEVRLYLNNIIAKESGTTNTLQIIGVIATLLFFFGFLFLVVRRLAASDVKADEARQETEEIMNTVSTGLFLLDKDLNIGSQYSKELERLIGQKNLAGHNLVEVLGNLISQEDLNTTHSFIGQLYNPRVKERLIGSLNPLTRQPMTVQEGNNSVVRYLDFKFNRVYKGDEISRVLVNVSDVTNAVLLEKKIQQEREQNDIQLEMLSTILRADRQMIDDFVRNTQKHNMAINNTLKAPGERQSELRSKAEHIFREVHSLKGEAYALNLHGFTVIAENIENDLKKLQATPTLTGENFLGLAVHLEELMNLTQTIEDLVNRLGSNSDVVHGNQSAAGKPKMSDYYERLVADVAERNSKIVDFNYVGLQQVDNEDLRTTIHEVAVQLLRNAVVHGIETPAERHARRKLEAGHVRMELQDNGSQYVLQLEDDGNGINYEAIRAKGVALGRYTEEEAAGLGTKELLALMFSSGFSTVEQATGDAGRGVGLDVIKDRVNALGGKINISTSAGMFTRFTFTFPK